MCRLILAFLLLSLPLLAAEKSSKASKPARPAKAIDPVEEEYQRLLEMDDAAHAEVDKWILDNQAFAEKGAGLGEAALRVKAEQRFESVRKAYEQFLERNPGHARARVAYGSFLNDLNDEDGAEIQWKKARDLDPSNPAVWNNLANLYGHSGRVRQAFDHYEKAISLRKDEPVYYQNFATTVFMFRMDAMDHFKITEQEVFDKALTLYRQAFSLDPKNFIYATEIAQCFYIIRPLRLEEARKAWQVALDLARDDIESQGVHLHLARIEFMGENYNSAKTHLAKVEHEMYASLKKKISDNVQKKEAGDRPSP
jgi:tetratricopeptide (TPR) repeat protein